MAHANTYVLGIRDELHSLGFAVSDCIVFRPDDPQGNFGIAYYFGRYDGCGHMAYDEGYLPTRHTVVHEFGHDMHSRWEGQDIAARFWAEVGFPLSMAQSIDKARSLSEYQRWRHRPGEMLAEMFAWTVLGDRCATEMHGVLLTAALRSKLAAFFRSFKEEDMALSDVDRATIRADIDAGINRVLARVATMEVDILREVMGKLDSGFNVSVPTHIDRQTAGDAKVATAEKE